VTPDRRHAVKHGPFTTWQWAVLGAYFAAIVLSLSVWGLARRANENARRGNAAICVEVAFLQNSLRATERALKENPTAPENPARRVSAQRLRDLVGRLEAEVPNCHVALS
jgi:hypothetical protein